MLYLHEYILKVKLNQVDIKLLERHLLGLTSIIFMMSFYYILLLLLFNLQLVHSLTYGLLVVFWSVTTYNEKKTSFNTRTNKEHLIFKQFL